MDQNFELATQFADAASTLDWMKNYAPECERAAASEQVEKLHDKAQELAGDRVHEIYCPEDAYA